MRKNSMGVRVLSLLLALTMVLSLCGCRDDGERPEMETNDNGEISITDQERATRPAEGPIAQMHNDDTIASHIAHNAEVNPAPVPEREAKEFHLFVTNNETMLGFVNSGNQMTDYVNGLQSALKAAHDMYGNLYSHSLATGGAAEALDDRKVQAHTYYYGNELSAEGALASLFRSGTPFGENALSLIVSNFVEPGFDLTCLSDGIKQYFDSYERSAACVVGFSSYFEGDFHIPQITAAGERTTFCIQNFKGEVPCYMVVVGPQEAVEQYTERLFKYLDNQNVTYSYENFSNCIYEEHFAQPLVFDLVSDIKAQKLPTGTPFSYNTGTLTEHEAGNAYFTTYANVETRDGMDRKKVRGETEPTVPEDAVKVANSSQIALMSRNYDGVSNFDYETALYIYNKDTQTWADAGKNAQLMVNATLTPVSGEWKVPVVDKEYVFLADNREEMYAAVQLDFGTDDILSRDEVYRLEMKIHLNQEQGSKAGEIDGTGLNGYYIDNNTYYSIRDVLNRGRLLSGDFRWTALFPGERDTVTGVVCKTPNLEALLISLRELEDDYKTHTEMYTYLDFVFNIREKGASGGRRG